MTSKFNNVYIKDAYTIGGIYESEGPIAKYFDKVYNNDFYFGEKSFEKAESHILKEAIESLLNKCNLQEDKVDLVISGDLQNQLAASDYALRDINIPFLGIFSACATCGEGLAIASIYLEHKKNSNVIVATSSHNLLSEKQFRNPNEYGTPKPHTATFTSTGAVSILVTSTKTNLKIESVTIGKVMDLNQKDANNMGSIMAPAAADTIYRHLKDLKRDPSYYDLILTGDLGKYGKQILIDYMNEEYKINLNKNYDDCGLILYDVNKQPVLAGASGPVSSALVGFSYILNKLKTGKLNKILLVPTGAIFSPQMSFQKESIPSIAHAISIERVEL